MSRSSQLGWSGLWCSRQCNNICAAECWCVLTEASPEREREGEREREREREKEMGVFSYVQDTAFLSHPPLHPSPLNTHLYRVLTRKRGWAACKPWSIPQPRYANCTKLETPTKEAFETSRVLSYHWRREKDDFSRVREEEGRGGVRKQVWTSLWIELLKGRVSNDWGWMDASPQGERGT